MFIPCVKGTRSKCSYHVLEELCFINECIDAIFYNYTCLSCLYLQAGSSADSCSIVYLHLKYEWLKEGNVR